MLNMASYFVMAGLAGMLRRERPSAIIGVSVHPLAALAALLLARLRHARFYLEITDLWPETLIEFGRISRKGLTARVMRTIERRLFKDATRIFMLWKNTADYVRSLGISADKIVWFPHGVELERYVTLPDYDGSAKSPFTVMYLGGFVDANDLTTIVAAAQELQRRGRMDILFELVGASTNKDLWVHRVAELGLTNVFFPAPVPKSQIARVMIRADAFIYAVRDLPIYRFGISTNKLVDYLASGRPIIFAGNSSYDPVRETGAGISVAAENAIGVADAVEKLQCLPAEDRARMGQNGRRHLMENHLIPILADRLIATLQMPQIRQ